MLFIGDAGAQSEARMLAAGAGLEADVLKVGHHGSAYSSTPAFIAAIQPRYALISVGLIDLRAMPRYKRRSIDSAKQSAAPHLR
jgi:beta-lactamase superfamily II metal-dependent hydrolase